MSSESFNRIEINLAALLHNYRCIVERAGSGVRVMTVVKADGYGHGMVAVARALAAAGVNTFGVADVEEGIELRQSGIVGDITVLLGAPVSAVGKLVRYKLTPVVYDPEVMEAYEKKLHGSDSLLAVHLKVDVGMGRLGILAAEVDDFLIRLQGCAHLKLTGVLSHFPMADDPDSDVTGRQLQLFKDIVAGVEKQYGSGTIQHIANSAALAYDPATHLDMIRPGISLYGYHADGIDGPGARRYPLDLQPVMSFKTRVIQVKELEAGSGVSYGHTFVAGRRTRIAVLPVGYGDGYCRALSNRAWVLVNGKRAPVRGRICMSLCMVDITDADPGRQVAAGDEVVLMGRQGGEQITADEVAAWMDTISYEVLCLFGSRTRREYVYHG